MINLYLELVKPPKDEYYLIDSQGKLCSSKCDNNITKNGKVVHIGCLMKDKNELFIN